MGAELDDSVKLVGIGNGRHEQTPSQPAIPPPITVPDALLPKLHTWYPNEPARSARIGREGGHHHDVIANGGDSREEEHLEMKEIEFNDIDVIPHLSPGVGPPSFAGNGGAAQVAAEVDGAAVGAAEIVESSHVWYACYGSNMHKPRFMCYIEGGQIESMARPCIGCRDKSPPVRSEWLDIRNRLFFGHQGTETWGLGGVAFIDPVPEPGVSTHVRIYKITMEQFNDVISQENPGKVKRNWMIGRHIDHLKREPHHLMEIFKGSWYGTVKFLGEKDGFPILTFTCPQSHMAKFRSGELRTLAPSASYRSVIVRGLVEDFGLSEAQAHDYVSSAVLPKRLSSVRVSNDAWEPIGFSCLEIEA